MVFSSITFLCIFFPLVFLFHWILPDIKWKNVFLILASLLFYAYGEPVYVLLMTASAFVNYILGMLVRTGSGGNKAAAGAAIVLNVGVLALFKYAGFFLQPIGISFFTFQALSYVIDVYRGTIEPQKNFGKVLLYISFFPQLIAGPIVKYHDIAREIENRRVTVEGAARGMRRFAAGLSKKVLIANVLGQTADLLFAESPGNINILTAWLAAISYLLQIYFDFSGYSDMALGMGQMFGFHLKENFDYPYCSNSVREFWRRWHISLSGWFREYLYFPLGGNRKGRWRTVINKFIVFFCTGLWHGANVTFVIWGLYHGFFLMLEEYFPIPEKAGRGRLFFGRLYTLLTVTVGFVIFRADTLGQGVFFIREMFTGFHFEPAAVSLAVQQFTPLFLLVLATGCISAMPLKACLQQKKGYEPFSWLCSIAGLALCLFSLSGNTYNPFIYFRF